MAELTSFTDKGFAPFLRQMRIRNGVAKFTLTEAATLTARSPNFMDIDVGGATKVVTLPAEAESEGLFFFVYNSSGAGEDITLNNDAAGLVTTINEGESACVACDGTTWHLIMLTTVELATIRTDTISEATSGSGVTVDGVLLKDSQMTTDVILEKTGAAGVTIDSVLLKDGALTGARRAANTTAVAISGATTLTLDDSGGIFSVAQSSTYDIDLPSPTTGPGLRYCFYLTGAAAFSPTITVAGSAATFVGTIVLDASVIPATGGTLTFATGAAALGDYIEIESISTTLYHVRAVSSDAAGITVA